MPKPKKTFWDMSLDGKIGIMQVMIPIWFMPPRLRRIPFSKTWANRLMDAWRNHLRIKAICLFADRPREIHLAGDRRLSDRYMGVTRLYHVASVTLNFKSIAKCLRLSKTIPLVQKVTMSQQIWQTLLHEFGHAAARWEPRDREDHGLSFHWRLLKVYLFAWYHCYFGVLREQ